MEQPILSDKNIFPTDKIIFSNIGKSKTFWISLFEYIDTNYPEISREWRYYNDGKRWLLKVTRKAKTIFWLSIIENSFRITFYLNDRAGELIAKSDISDDLKEQYHGGKKYGKIRGVTIIFKNKKDVEYAKTLIGIKTSLK